MNYQKNLEKLGLKLPDAKAPVGNYVATKIAGNMLFVSGQISIAEKGELIKLLLEYELFEEKIFWSSDTDFFQSYLEFLYLNGGKNNENDSGNKHSN